MTKFLLLSKKNYGIIAIIPVEKSVFIHFKSLGKFGGRYG